MCPYGLAMYAKGLTAGNWESPHIFNPSEHVYLQHLFMSNILAHSAYFAQDMLKLSYPIIFMCHIVFCSRIKCIRKSQCVNVSLAIDFYEETSMFYINYVLACKYNTFSRDLFSS